ncbi:unnamed protein product [Rotaria sp. Silwood2]|nr:unnamed protein product [Rotaria sp. Silwood2]CAF3138033.1 unnamed protein product [Rotaria sp. Silwood2]CAF3452852.1 unnamed protein product [Rotaria sp. Silwood2]CAF4303787.1 unnamed protein product [Rotaria sp. Silwood2]CAF4510231.1 unnamed protein product [Rotaria sp. Silwood2]
MSAKQSQITSFFSQNKKQKTNKDFDGNSASVDILSINLYEIQGETGLCAEISSLEPSKISTLASLTSSPFTSPSSIVASLTSPSSALASLTSPSSTSSLPTSLSSTSASLTSPSSTLASSTTK